MKEWHLKVFQDENKRSDFRQWYVSLPPKVRARMHKILVFMETQKDWTKTPYFRPLTGYKGICEIRVTVSGQQYRPLGCYGPDPNTFTLLVGAKEVGSTFVPKSAPDIATQRRKLILKDRRFADDY